MKIKHWCRFLVLLASSVILNVSAQDIYDLERDRDVEIIAWVGDKNAKSMPTYSVNQQVILYIEVATPRWFTQGTRIGTIEVPNVIAKQRNQLATNYTQRENGETWARQRWEVTLYPQESGRIVVPSIPVEVGVSAPDGSKVVGHLYTNPVAFNTTLPSGLLTSEQQWFVASQAQVDQKWQVSQEALKVGDVITRTVSIAATDSLSVLLPQVMNSDSSEQFQAYATPNDLEDTQTRGVYKSKRTEQVTYVVQQGGDITFPDYSVTWWDSKKEALQTVVLKGKSYSVKHTLRSWLKQYWLMLSIMIAVSLGIGILLRLTSRYYRTHPKPAWWLFRQAIKNQQWSRARTYLYRKQRRATGRLELPAIENEQHKSAIVRFYKGEQNEGLFRTLWRKIQPFSHNGNSPKNGRLVIPKALPALDNIGREKK